VLTLSRHSLTSSPFQIVYLGRQVVESAKNGELRFWNKFEYFCRFLFQMRFFSISNRLFIEPKIKEINRHEMLNFNLIKQVASNILSLLVKI
jgi:hypothetical protein